jgi:hypothetical protein
MAAWQLTIAHATIPADGSRNGVYSPFGACLQKQGRSIEKTLVTNRNNKKYPGGLHEFVVLANVGSSIDRIKMRDRC